MKIIAASILILTTVWWFATENPSNLAIAVVIGFTLAALGLATTGAVLSKNGKRIGPVLLLFLSLVSLIYAATRLDLRPANHQTDPTTVSASEAVPPFHHPVEVQPPAAAGTEPDEALPLSNAGSESDESPPADDSARITATMDIAALTATIRMYSIETTHTPSTEQGLEALVSEPTINPVPVKWKQQLDKVPLDPWGKPFQYRFPGVHNPDLFDLFSWGPDGVESDDDIGNWSK